MEIEPRSVAPGFVKRWSIQSIALIFRSPVIWGVFILIAFLMSKVLESVIVYIFLGGWIFMISTK